MKSTTFIAVLLTLLALLLIVGAASLFMVQGRQDLLNEVNSLQETVLERESNLDRLQTTIEAQESDLQTRQARLDQSILHLAEGENELEELQATLEAMEAAQQPAGPPILDILSPTNGVSVASDTPLPLIIVAFAGEGVERIDVQFSDRQEIFSESGDGDAYVDMNRRLFDPTPGTLTITATLTTVDNQMQQSSIRILVNAPTPAPEETEEPEAEDTQGSLRAPVAHLRP